MTISQLLLDELSAQAKANPRIRQNYDLRTSSEDGFQRMLNRWSSESRRLIHLHYAESRQRKTIVNALEPRTVMPIHRHMKSSESIAMIRGKMIMRLNDDNGIITDEFTMKPCGEYLMVHVENGQWHSLEVLEEGTVVFEAKDGRNEALRESEVMKFNILHAPRTHAACSRKRALRGRQWDRHSALRSERLLRQGKKVLTH